MTTTQIDISGYSNEDIDRQFTLKTGNASASTPYDLTDASFIAEVRDNKNSLVLHLDTDSGGITIDDAPNGVFTIHIAQRAIPALPNRSLQYDLLMIAGGETKRLWGGTVRIAQGVTVP
jgi:hypothetical protein